MMLSSSLLLLAIIRMCMVLRKQDASSAEQMSRGLGEALKWRSDLPVCSADAGMVILLAIGLLFRLALC